MPTRILQRVLDRMRADLATNLDLHTIAAESGYSRTHFLGTFRASTGYSPHQWLTHLRIEEAKTLLQKASNSLIDVALDCGFSSHGHFSNTFRRIVGVAPREYRRGRACRLPPVARAWRRTRFRRTSPVADRWTRCAARRRARQRLRASGRRYGFRHSLAGLGKGYPLSATNDKFTAALSQAIHERAEVITSAMRCCTNARLAGRAVYSSGLQCR